MAVTPLFSDEENRENSEKKPLEVIYPDSILIDDRDDLAQNASAQDSSQEKHASYPSQKNGFFLRFLSFLGVIFCLVFGTGMFLIASFFTVVCALSFFQNQEHNRNILRYWKIAFKTIYATLCFILGIISPALGLGLLALFFSGVNFSNPTDSVKGFFYTNTR